jgi:hypothetical protein
MMILVHVVVHNNIRDVAYSRGGSCAAAAEWSIRSSSLTPASLPKVTYPARTYKHTHTPPYTHARAVQYINNAPHPAEDKHVMDNYAAQRVSFVL